MCIWKFKLISLKYKTSKGITDPGFFKKSCKVHLFIPLAKLLMYPHPLILPFCSKVIQQYLSFIRSGILDQFLTCNNKQNVQKADTISCPRRDFLSTSKMWLWGTIVYFTHYHVYFITNLYNFSWIFFALTLIELGLYSKYLTLKYKQKLTKCSHKSKSLYMFSQSSPWLTACS